MALVGAILDFDGTLIDSIEAWRDLEHLLVKEAIVPVTPQDRARFATFTLDETACWFHDHLGIGKSAEAVRKTMDDFMVDHFSHSAKVLPGVKDFLESCKQQGVVMSIASSSPQIYLQTALKATGLLPYFSFVLSVEDVGRSKRDPYIFDHARELMATPKESTGGFDDSLYAIDVMKNAGYPTVGIYDPYEHLSFEQWKERATIAVRSFEELSLSCFDR